MPTPGSPSSARSRQCWARSSTSGSTPTATRRPCRAAASTTRRTAAAPGWCSASMSSLRRSMRRTAGSRHTVSIALSPQGRPLTQELVEALAKEEHLTLLSARFEGFDERIVEHLCTDSISIGPYVLSNGDLPAMVLLDAIARRLPGRARGGVRRVGELFRGARRQARVSALHAPGRVPRLARSRRPSVGRPRPNRELAEGACPLRNPIDRLTVGLPRGLRVTIDWLVTILGAILIVLAIKQWVINPYRIPSSSMEPTLHCALPGAGLPGQRRALQRLRPRARLPHLLRDRRARSAATSSSSTRRRGRWSPAARAACT